MLVHTAFAVRSLLVLLAATPALRGQETQDPPAPQPVTEPVPEKVAPEDRPEFAYRATTNEHPYVEMAGIVARDPRTGDLGGIVLSSSPMVGSFCMEASAAAGIAVASGNPDPTWPKAIVALLAKGLAPDDAIKQLKESSSTTTAERQALVVLGADGRPANHMGEYVFGVGKTTEVAAQPDWIAFTTYPSAPQLMINLKKEFPATEGLPLPERLIVSMQRALEPLPNDAKGKRADLAGQAVSSALLVVRKDGGRLGGNDRFIDLRVDFALEPIDHLRGLYSVWCQAHLGPALRQSMTSILDTQSDAYKANQQWLRRLRSRTKIGEKR